MNTEIIGTNGGDPVQILLTLLSAAERRELGLAETWLAEHPEGSPDWYSRAEIFDWLRRMNYTESWCAD